MFKCFRPLIYAVLGWTIIAPLRGVVWAADSGPVPLAEIESQIVKFREKFDALKGSEPDFAQFMKDSEKVLKGYVAVLQEELAKGGEVAAERQRKVREILGLSCGALSAIAYRSGRLPEAESWAIESTEADPENPRLLMKLGIVQVKRGRFQQALDSFALTGQKLAEARQFLGQAGASWPVDKREALLKDYAQAEYYTAYYTDIALEKLLRLKEARELTESWLKQHPGDELFLFRRALLSWRLGDFLEGLGALDEILLQHPQSQYAPQVYEIKVNIYLGQQKYAEAAEACQKGLALNGGNRPFFFYNRLLLAQQLGQEQAFNGPQAQEGIEALEKILTGRPDDEDAMAFLLLIRARQGQGKANDQSASPYDTATLESRLRAKAGVDNPEPDALYDLARLTAVRGQVDQALNWLQQALDAGWTERVLLKYSPDFENLRRDQRFREMAAKLEERMHLPAGERLF